MITWLQVVIQKFKVYNDHMTTGRCFTHLEEDLHREYTFYLENQAAVMEVITQYQKDKVNKQLLDSCLYRLKWVFKALNLLFRLLTSNIDLKFKILNIFKILYCLNLQRRNNMLGSAKFSNSSCAAHNEIPTIFTRYARQYAFSLGWQVSETQGNISYIDLISQSLNRVYKWVEHEELRKYF